MSTDITCAKKAICMNLIIKISLWKEKASKEQSLKNKKGVDIEAPAPCYLIYIVELSS